jgi:tetratricopeptide (TPR) repeat protein
MHCLASMLQASSSPLSHLPVKVHQNVVLVEAGFRSRQWIEHVTLTVNDVPAFAARPKDRARFLPIRTAITLRPGDNVVSFEAVFESNSVRRWVAHVFREPDRKGTRFAVLLDVAQSPASRDRIQEVLVVLRSNGIPDDQIGIFSQFDALRRFLATVAERTVSGDQVLFYFLGSGRISQLSGEPVLNISDPDLSATSGMLISDLLRQLSSFDLPAISLLIDAGFHTTPPSPGDISSEIVRGSAFADAQRMAASWLRNLPIQSNIEIAISNYLNPIPEYRAGALTDRILGFLRFAGPEVAPCETLADVSNTVTKSDSRASPNAPQVLYFAANDTLRSFCLRGSSKEGVLTLKASIVPSAIPPHQAGSITTLVPDNLAPQWAETFVDGVLLEHRSLTKGKGENGHEVEEHVPLSEGTHLIEIRVGSGTTFLASGATELAVRDRAQAPVSVSNDLSASFFEPTETHFSTTDGVMGIEALISNAKQSPFEFEVRNNGVVIYRGIKRTVTERQYLEIFKQMELTLGTNNILVEAQNGDKYKLSQCLAITRRTAQPIRAVIIGANEFSSSQLPQKPTVAEDAELIKDLLLRYTDSSPSRMAFLTGVQATAKNVEHDLSDTSSQTLLDPFPYGDTSAQTLFLYFAGLGTTIVDNNGHPVRCILLYDSDPSNLRDTCLSTNTLDALLDTWKRAIVVFDTSYDGLAEPPASSSGDHRFSSRTYTNFFSPDAGWRLSAGINRDNRVFVVGSGTNSASLEDLDLGHGLFTFSLAQSVRTQLAEKPLAARSDQSISLLDAYVTARNETALLSNKQQIPVIRGTLSQPFAFYETPTAELKRQTTTAATSAQRDIEELRSPTIRGLKHATEVLLRLQAIAPSDEEVAQALALILLYQGDAASATKLTESSIERLATSAEMQRELAVWLTINSEIKMYSGDLIGAIHDCEQATLLQPSYLKALYILGELYMAVLDFKKALDLLTHLTSNFGSAAGADNLSDAEWAHAIVLTYICVKLTDPEVNGKDLLRTYFAENTESWFLFRALLSKRVARGLFHRSQKKDPDNLDLGEDWSKAVADYLLDPQHFEESLRSYREEKLIFDRKDSKAFDCVLHFNLGMVALMGKNFADAQQEFRATVETKQIQYPEFWTAKAELERMHQ